MKPCWRSLLFVPAHDRVLLAKSIGSGADAVILDLEDGVPASAKQVAREGLGEAVTMLRQAGMGAIVRVNASWRMALVDVDWSIGAGTDAIMVPKAEDAAKLVALAELIGEFEVAGAPAETPAALVPLIETAAGLTGLTPLAALPRVAGLALGTEDFSLSLGVDPTPECLDLPCRSLALAAASAGKMAFAMPLSIAEFRDEEAIRAAAALARRYGATGALCIHPVQVRIVNAAFAPGAEQVATARAILAAWEEAQARGEAVTTLDGRMIDAPVVARAARTLGGLTPT